MGRWRRCGARVWAGGLLAAWLVGSAGAGGDAAAAVRAADLPPAPLVANGYARVTRQEELLTFVRACAAASPRLELETIGRSGQGRELVLVRARPAAGEAGLKVLIFCQQHGNEASGKEAALLLLRRIAAGGAEEEWAGLDLYVVPCVNPDGNEAGRRTNAAGADLNRNHLLRTEPEVRALHGAAARIDPAVTLDVHEYQPNGREWREAGVLRRMDEQFGAPTNLNVSPRLVELGKRQLFPFLREQLAAKGIVFFDYIILDGPLDSARHSTTAVNDGRQSFAIENRFSFILEGRNGREANDALERRATHQLAAIEAFLRFVQLRAEEIGRAVREEAARIATTREPVVLRMEHGGRGERLAVPVQRVDNGAEAVQEVAYRPRVEASLSVARPQAYVMRREQREAIAWLERNQVRFETVTAPRTERLEVSAVVGEKKHRVEDKELTELQTRERVEAVRLEAGDVVVPLAQRAGTLVAIALEPASMWGLVTQEAFKEWRKVGVDYPVLRRR